MTAHAHPIASTASTLMLPQPYLLFLGDVTEAGFAKTAFGLRDWAADSCVGEYALPGATVSTGLVQLTPAQAAERGARSMLIGVANQGGVIPQGWRASLIEALNAGLDLVSGMHARLAEIPGLADEAARLGRQLIDVRVPPATLPIATGRKRNDLGAPLRPAAGAVGQGEGKAHLVEGGRHDKDAPLLARRCEGRLSTHSGRSVMLGISVTRGMNNHRRDQADRLHHLRAVPWGQPLGQPGTEQAPEIMVQVEHGRA